MTTNKLFNKSSLLNSKKDKLTFKERIAALGNLPAFFKMVWQTSPAMTICNLLLRIVKSAIPVATLYVGKLIIDNVIHISKDPHHSGINMIWKLIALELVLAVSSDLLNRIISLIDTLLGDLFSKRTSIQIMAHAATLDLDQFEDSVFYDKLERDHG